MRRITPVYLLAVLLVLAAVALAAAATPLHPKSAPSTPAPILRYSTVGSCACDVPPADALAAATSIAPQPMFPAWQLMAEPTASPRN